MGDWGLGRVCARAGDTGSRLNFHFSGPPSVRGGTGVGEWSVTEIYGHADPKAVNREGTILSILYLCEAALISGMEMVFWPSSCRPPPLPPRQSPAPETTMRGGVDKALKSTNKLIPTPPPPPFDSLSVYANDPGRMR